MRIILSSLASCSILLLGASYSAEAPKTMSDCIQISNDDERLACFDELAKQPNLDGDNLTNSPTAKSIETPIQREKRFFGFNFSRENPDTEEDFGRRAPPIREVKEVSSEIVDVKFRAKDPAGYKLRAYRIELANGQIWEQTETDRYSLRKFRDEVTYQATVRRGALDSFLMEIEPMGRTIRVRRVE